MKTPIKISIKVQRIIGTLSRMSILNNATLKQGVFLYSSFVLQELNYFIILRFKISCFILYLWSPRYFKLCLRNRLSNLSFFIFTVYFCFGFEFVFRVYFRFGFELAQYKLQCFCCLFIKSYCQRSLIVTTARHLATLFDLLNTAHLFVQIFNYLLQ